MKIFVARKLPKAVEEKLSLTFETKFSGSERPLSQDQILSALEGCDALVCAPGDQIDTDLIGKLPDCVQTIATFSVGTDHIDLAACQARSIMVTNTPDVLTDATADLALLLMLSTSRRAYEGEQMVRTQSWTGWHPTQLMGVSLQGKTLGIVGMGRIGQALAKRARAFDMEIAYYNRRPLPKAQANGARYLETVSALCQIADVLSLHCPLTPETHHLINEARLQEMKPGAILVNTARGPVIDDAAMIKALKEGRLLGAGLDVFSGEPNVHPGYLDLANVTLLPHLGSATVETRTAMGFRVFENLKAIADAVEPPHRVV